MQPISKRDREIIVKHKENKEKNENIAKWLFVSVSTITRIWKLYQQTGGVETKTHKAGRKPSISKDEFELIAAKIDEQPDITLNQLIEEFELKVSEGALSKRLKKEGLTFKKRLSIRKNKSDRT